MILATDATTVGTSLLEPVWTTGTSDDVDIGNNTESLQTGSTLDLNSIWKASESEKNNSLEGLIRDLTTQATTVLQELSTNVFNITKNSTQEVYVSTELMSPEDPDIGTAEKVVIGAAILVAVMAVIAITLRMCGPYIRSRVPDEEPEMPEKSFSIETIPVKLR